jgi:hypothetical protein
MKCSVVIMSQNHILANSHISQPTVLKLSFGKRIVMSAESSVVPVPSLALPYKLEN